jgi:isoprenylcysteine carboxyl methyltransferase (ICMT) family protein YpbQ
VLTETAYQLHQNFILCAQITLSSSSASCLCLFHPFLLFFAVVVNKSATSASFSANQKQLVTIHNVFPKPQFLWCFHYLRRQWTHGIIIKGNRFD